MHIAESNPSLNDSMLAVALPGTYSRQIGCFFARLEEERWLPEASRSRQFGGTEAADTSQPPVVPDAPRNRDSLSLHISRDYHYCLCQACQIQ